MLGEPGDVEAQFIRLLNLLDNATDVVLYRSAAISPSRQAEQPERHVAHIDPLPNGCLHSVVIMACLMPSPHLSSNVIRPAGQARRRNDALAHLLHLDFPLARARSVK